MPERLEQMRELVRQCHGDIAVTLLRQHPDLTTLAQQDDQERWFVLPRTSRKQRVYGTTAFEAVVKALFIDWNVRDPEFCEIAQFENGAGDQGTIFCAFCPQGDDIHYACPGSCRPREGVLEGCAVSARCPCHAPASLARLSAWLEWRHEHLRRRIASMHQDRQGKLTPLQSKLYAMFFGEASA